MPIESPIIFFKTVIIF